MPKEAFVLAVLFLMGTFTALIGTSCTLYCVIFSQRFKYSASTIAPVVIPKNVMKKEQSNISPMDLQNNYGRICIEINNEEGSTVSDQFINY